MLKRMVRRLQAVPAPELAQPVCAEYAPGGGSSLPVNLPLSLPSDTLFPSEGERDRVRGSPAGSGAHCALNIRRVPSSRVRGVDGSTATWCRISKALLSQSAETNLSTVCTDWAEQARESFLAKHRSQDQLMVAAVAAFAGPVASCAVKQPARRKRSSSATCPPAGCIPPRTCAPAADEN